MALETELATYKAKLPEWRAHEGKFVLIHGGDVVNARVREFFSMPAPVTQG
jgi:hypothetical protein